MLEIISLTKKFGSFTAVENLSIKVDIGEIYGFYFWPERRSGAQKKGKPILGHANRAAGVHG